MPEKKTKVSRSADQISEMPNFGVLLIHKKKKKKKKKKRIWSPENESSNSFLDPTDRLSLHTDGILEISDLGIPPFSLFYYFAKFELIFDRY